MSGVPSILDLILPPACVACGSRGHLLCDRCSSEMVGGDPMGHAFAIGDPLTYVGEAVLLATAAFAYDGPARRALHRLKYGGAARIAPILAERARPAFGRLRAVTGTDALLVPVPAARDRELARGYNQAALLASALARTHRLAVRPLLLRTTATAAQHRLDRAARRRNLRNAIRLAPGAIAPATVILVDDILTTGATLEACADALVGGGCASVYGFAIAREV